VNYNDRLTNSSETSNIARYSVEGASIVKFFRNYFDDEYTVCQFSSLSPF